MLAVSRTQSLHDAATPTTDNPHWGYAPNPIFKNYIGLSTVCTVAVRHRFAKQNKTAPTKADAVNVTMILSDLSDNLDFGKNTLRQCLYCNARTGRL